MLLELRNRRIAGAVAARLSVQIDFAERRQESAYPRDMRAYGLRWLGDDCGITAHESEPDREPAPVAA